MLLCVKTHIDANSHELADSRAGDEGRESDGTYRVATAQRLDIKESEDFFALEELERRDVTYCCRRVLVRCPLGKTVKEQQSRSNSRREGVMYMYP